jgi:hypothetical protein
MVHQGKGQYFPGHLAFQIGMCHLSFEMLLALRIRTSLMLGIKVWLLLFWKPFYRFELDSDYHRDASARIL